MCRVLSYLGHPLLIEELLYNPDNSFIKQSYDPKLMSKFLNLAGFGLAVWVDSSYQPKLPFLYQSLQLPFYDKVLQNFSSKIMSRCFLSHLRGVDYTHKQIVSLQNIHPFLFDGTNIVFAHNGDLFHFDKMKYDLLPYILPQFKINIYGTTDSEWVYALFMSSLNLKKPHNDVNNLHDALRKTLAILKKVRRKNKIEVHSPINLFISNGEFILALRYVLDFGNEAPPDENVDPSEYHSLWYTIGKQYCKNNHTYEMQKGDKEESIIIASEPLTSDTSSWIEVPKSNYVFAEIIENQVKLISDEI